MTTPIAEVPAHDLISVVVSKCQTPVLLQVTEDASREIDQALPQLETQFLLSAVSPDYAGVQEIWRKKEEEQPQEHLEQGQSAVLSCLSVC